MTSKIIKSLNEVMQTRDSWYFAVRTLRAWVDVEDQDPYRPSLILTINGMNGRIQDYKIVKHAGDEIVKEALVSAMLEPSESLKSISERPSQINFEDRDLMDFLLPFLQDIDVIAKYLPNHVLVNEIAVALEQKMREGIPDFPGLLSVQGVTPSMVGDLFDAAADFYQSAPWAQLTGEDILSIQVSPQKDPFYASILGYGGTEYGLALYKQWDDVELMYSIHDSIGEVVPADGTHLFLFEEIYEIPFDDIDAIERYGWKVFDSHSYPEPVIFTRDKEIERPDRDEVLWYQAALRSIPVFVLEHLRFDEENNLKPAQAEIPVQTTSGNLLVKIEYTAGVLPERGRHQPLIELGEIEAENELPFDRRALEGDIARMLETDQAFNFQTDLGKAQDLVYQAWDEPNPAKRIILAHKALSISPDCADAYVLLAEEEADSLQSALEHYQKGIEAGRRALGEEIFEQDAGHFWLMLETRPYMRALYGYADCLWNLDGKDAAVKIFEEMLRLNPGDNQGIRYILVDRLLSLNREKDLDDLLSQYEGDYSAVWLYTQALEIFRRQGGADEARTALNDALEYNPFVPDFLMGKKRIPNRLPEYIGIGDENEAVSYASDHLKHWRRIPGAVDWLQRNVEAQD